MVKEVFSSRWALLLATMGMAVGAGNIWRFPRLAGQYGGAFLVPWVIFLLVWSIPLLMVEFSIGKETRKGPIGAFSQFLGEKYAWMGGFVAFCTMGIMFYYSVVTGWALKYMVAAIAGDLQITDHAGYWDTFTGGTAQPIFFHLISLAIASFIIYQGVVKGIERANRILLPSLLVLLIIGVVRSLTLDNAAAGLNYLFGFQDASLWDYRMWLEALSQSAWSTGAGWGLVLTYSIYMRENDDVPLNSFITGFGNNSASLLAGLAIVPAIFSLTPTPEAAKTALQAGNEGLGFIVIPQLFQQLPGAQLMVILFFVALFFAAMSSLIAMMELATRVMMDFGIKRSKALPIVAGVTALMGIPSAMSLDFFKNQDWVWGLGLILSGSFFAFAGIKHGVTKFRDRYINTRYSELYIGKWFDWILKYLIPFEAIAMMIWWTYQSIYVYDPDGWWKPFRSFSMGTCLLQWGLLITILLLFNRYITRRIAGGAGS